MVRAFTVRDLAVHLSGAVIGSPDRLITGVSSPGDAGPQDLIFIDSARHAGELERSAAGAAILPGGVEPPPHISGISVENPALGLAAAIELLVPRERAFRDVSPRAFLEATAEIGPDVGIGPHAYVGAGVRIGRGTEIHPGTTIGCGTIVGEDCVIHSGVHIYPHVSIGHRVIVHSGCIIGADGFRYVREAALSEPAADAPAEAEFSRDRPMRHRKIRHIGRVVIEADVEIGANTTIDRATLSVTRIGRGTKIDNLVTVGHNCTVGRHCIIIGQAGISGSTVIGDYVTIAGQAGLVGHLEIGAGAVIGAQAGVTKDIPAGQVVLGSPAVEARRAKKALALLDSLPEFKQRLAALERQRPRSARSG
jgi:UDP-3-O-[3-hydroxymyristoyl] glucosamine N-acyltransferase